MRTPKVAVSKSSCQKEYRIPCRGLCPLCDRIAAFFAGDFTSFIRKEAAGCL